MHSYTHIYIPTSVYRYAYIYTHTVVKISIRHLISAQICLKICVWYLDLMGICIHIQFYNNFPQKKRLLRKIRFQGWK